MNFEFWMALRYLKARKDKLLSLMNVVAIAGIAIGVAALIIVIAVMTGFDRDLRDKIVGANAHVVVEKETGVKQYKDMMQKLSSVPGVAAMTPYIHGNVFLESGQRTMSLIMRGIDPSREGGVTKINSYLGAGSISTLKADEIVIGTQLASFYGYRIGDQITIIAPAAGVAGTGWRFTFTIAGIFKSGMYDYDMNLVLVNLSKAQAIFNLTPDVVTGIGLKLKDPQKAPEVKNSLYDIVGFSFMVRTWMENNANFFAALELEKFAMFVILTLIVLVASFNIIGTLIVTVSTKVKDIGILKSIGATKSMIHHIFMLQGLAVGAIGTFWGFVGGVGVCVLLKKYQFIKLPQDIYYIDRLPVLVQGMDIALIVAAAMTITYVATIYPAIKAAQLEPVDALRYE